MSRPYKITEEKRQQYAGIFVLDTIMDASGRIPLLLEGADVHLEPTLDWLHNRGHLEIVDNEHYSISDSGRLAVKRYRAHYKEFLRTFDIYSAVDLEEGSFAFERLFDFEDESDWDEYINRDTWDDLRVAVAELKEIDPVELVFLSFVNEGYLETLDGWQVALLSDEVWSEIEDICNNATDVDDLGFEDSEEGTIEGIDVLKDVIKEGAELNLELKKYEQELEDEDGDDEEDDDDDEEIIVEEYYQPYYDPYYVSPVWMAMWWL